MSDIKIGMAKRMEYKKDVVKVELSRMPLVEIQGQLQRIEVYRFD